MTASSATAPGSDDIYLDTADLAARWKRAASSIREMRRQGTGPRSAKFGKRAVYRLADVLAWEQAQYDKESA